MSCSLTEKTLSASLVSLNARGMQKLQLIVDCNYKDFLTTTGVLMSSGELTRQGDNGEAGRV